MTDYPVEAGGGSPPGPPTIGLKGRGTYLLGAYVLTADGSYLQVMD